jgi:glycyl-tRNA synthetase
MADTLMDKITSLVKRRGFIYAGSEIYGGLANTYDYGPRGVELLRNIKNAWWDFFVTRRDNIYGLDTSILMSPKVWEASGHTASFADVQVDCKSCKKRTRADHLIEGYFQSKDKEIKVEGYSTEQLEDIIEKEKIPCPDCGEVNWTAPRK